MPARVDLETKKRIEEQLSYGDTLQDWVEDAILAKLERQESDEGNSKTPATAD